MAVNYTMAGMCRVMVQTLCFDSKIFTVPKRPTPPPPVLYFANYPETFVTSRGCRPTCKGSGDRINICTKAARGHFLIIFEKNNF